MQCMPEDISLSLHMYNRLGFHPVHLLDTLERSIAIGTGSWLNEADTCVKVLWCMATFDCFRPKMYADIMAAMAGMPLASFSLWMRWEAVVAGILAADSGCAFLALPHSFNPIAAKRSAPTLSCIRAGRCCATHALRVRRRQAAFSKAAVQFAANSALRLRQSL